MQNDQHEYARFLYIQFPDAGVVDLIFFLSFPVPYIFDCYPLVKSPALRYLRTLYLA